MKFEPVINSNFLPKSVAPRWDTNANAPAKNTKNTIILYEIFDFFNKFLLKLTNGTQIHHIGYQVNKADGLTEMLVFDGFKNKG